MTGDKTGKAKAARFRVGDHVGWNSEAGRVSGTIIKVHTSDFDYKGHTHRASRDDPQYEIRSDKTDHVAAHRGRALTKLAQHAEVLPIRVSEDRTSRSGKQGHRAGYRSGSVPER